MNYSKEQLIGTMRFDFADGGISNTWFPYQDISEKDISLVQPKVNEIMFDKFNSYNKIIEECEGEGYDKEKLLEEDTEDFYYAIKLIPVKGVYNGYIYVYRK